MITSDKNATCKYHGIVYRYINKANCKEYDWSYIGCTMKENTRKTAWNNRKNPYAGIKIAQARKLYFDKFEYHVIAEFWSDNENELRNHIHKVEKEKITLYDSENKGYNINQHKPKSEKHRQNISKAKIGHTVTNETKRKISESHKKKAVWITTPTDGRIQIESISKAAYYLKRTPGFVYGRIHSTNTNPKDNIIITLAV